jgi:6-phosphofructokinase 1
MKRIGVLTGGGDAPGLNPAIRAVVLTAADAGIETTGILDGWEGMLEPHASDVWPLTPQIVRAWDREGGTNLGSSRTNPFRVGKDKVDRSSEVKANMARLGLDALVAIGGEDTLGVARRLADQGVPVVGLPKTIDKDLSATDYSLGFDTSVITCAEIIERSRTPAGSHHWVQVVEVMGRHAGHLALWSGVAGGANVILIPEHPFSLDRLDGLLDERLRSSGGGVEDRRRERYAIVVVAEGATAEKQDVVTIDGKQDDFGHARLGGIGAWLAEHIRRDAKLDARAVALGHPQRGGPPSAVDRIMGQLFGIAAVEAARAGQFGKMVSARGIAPACEIGLVSLAEATARLNVVDVERYYDTQRYALKRKVLK